MVLSFNKINKGYKNLDFGFLIFILPKPANLLPSQIDDTQNG